MDHVELMNAENKNVIMLKLYVELTRALRGPFKSYLHVVHLINRIQMALLSIY